MQSSPVLHVEDEEDDVFLVHLAFRRAAVTAPLVVVKDGQEAVEYLSGIGPYADREKYPFPCLVLLDLNLPRLPGFGVLRWLRGQTAFQDLPVVVFSSSDEARDKEQAGTLGANEYIVKPVDMTAFVGMIQDLKGRWPLQLGGSASASGER